MNITSKGNRYPGVFLAVEGVDGCGKTDTTKIVADAIKKKFPHHELVTFRAPGGTPTGEKLREILLNNVLQPTSELLLFLASHNETIHEVIIPALKRGAIVLTDRFIDSTYAYQGYGRQLLSEVKAIHKEILKSFDPDHVIYVRADQSIANSRISARSGANHLDNLESDIKQRISKGMSERTVTRLADDSSRVTIIENNGTVDELVASCNKFVESMVLEETYFSRRRQYEQTLESLSNKLNEVRLSRDRLYNRLITPDESAFSQLDEEISTAYNEWSKAYGGHCEFLQNNTPETFNKKPIQSKEQEVNSEKVNYSGVTYLIPNVSGTVVRTRTDFKDHEIARIVSELTDIAITYSGTQQLRQNINQYILEAFRPTK
jgi:dTMP kinase